MVSLAERHYANYISDLHANWSPHPGQLKVGRALINDGIRSVFVQAGRNWGKTELMAYLLWRWALANKGSENYFICPFMKQAKEIVWATNRLQAFGPKRWIKAVNNTELRITFINDSFIKCDGSDNVDAYRGVKPKGLTVFDEFKDFKPEFYDAYDPNLAAHNAPIIIIGTPSELTQCQFFDVADSFERHPEKVYFEAPTHENPHIPREWLEAKKEELYAKGEGDVWEREYMAKRVPGGVSKIFPMLGREHVREHQGIMNELWHDQKKLSWYLAADPAAATVFGVLFVAINPYNRMVYVLDEVYETEPGGMSVNQIFPVIKEKRRVLCSTKEWRQIYDEAATWFAGEVLDRFGEGFEPTHKHLRKKEEGLSIIKDALLQGKLVISDQCSKLYWEMDNYFKDKNGKIPKKDDHLIDCLRYVMGADFYTLNEEKEYVEARDEEHRGWSKISDDFPGLDDFGSPVGDDWMNLE